MKKEYNIPEMEVIILKQTDVVRTSEKTDIVEPNEGWW